MRDFSNFSLFLKRNNVVEEGRGNEISSSFSIIIEMTNIFKQIQVNIAKMNHKKFHYKFIYCDRLLYKTY